MNTNSSQIKYDGIVNILENPNNIDEFFYQTHSGRVGTFSLRLKKSMISTTIQPIEINLNRHFDQEFDALPSQYLPARPNCLCQLHLKKNDIVAASMPGTNAIHIIDLSSKRGFSIDTWTSRSALRIPLIKSPYALASHPLRETTFVISEEDNSYLTLID